MTNTAIKILWWFLSHKDSFLTRGLWIPLNTENLILKEISFYLPVQINWMCPISYLLLKVGVLIKKKIIKIIPEATLHQYSWNHIFEVYFISWYLFIVLPGKPFIFCLNRVARYWDLGLSWLSIGIQQRCQSHLGGAPQQLGRSPRREWFGCWVDSVAIFSPLSAEAARGDYHPNAGSSLKCLILAESGRRSD